MIVLYNPKATKPRNRRFPLSVLAIAAVLEGSEEFVIVDGNLDPHPTQTLLAILREQRVELLAVTVMPGPQTVGAVAGCREVRRCFPTVPIVWGGYFASNYTQAVLNAPYVDFAVRGQGEQTFLELLEAIRGKRELKSILGLSYKDSDGGQRNNPERPLRKLDAFPWYPYHRIPAEKYVLPTFLGRRTAVHQASIGCPFRCNFCGVVNFSGSREKLDGPARTEQILRHLAHTYGINAVQFYDNNFFLREDHARELADRIAPLHLRWWCEARVDIVLGYSDDTLRKLRSAGRVMIFFGVESGNDAALRSMKKQLTSEQTVELARRIREFGIVPEYSMIFGTPENAAQDVAEIIAFVRRIKKVNADVEIVVQTYVPTPQQDGAYGGVELAFPSTPDEWITPRWYPYLIR